MTLSFPVGGVHYPGNLAAVRSWFPDDAASLYYIDWLRWLDGFCCPHCGAKKDWR
ncbi:transposase [Synechococcus sp. Tobar12-5m-g]|nr:transposase [Synechococcus sp. Tobar12-5m-g]MCP9874266.1 transposase [Synechococcus sp. Cruz CV-v-12]